MAKSALVAIADGTEEIEAVTIIDTLRRGGVDVTVASVAGEQVTASRRVRLLADCRIDACAARQFDLIVLPGGMPGAEHLRDCATLIDMLHSQARSAGFYGAICASPGVVLAPHNLLGARATVYPTMADSLGGRFVDEAVVVDGVCVTSQGPATAMGFALKLVELLCGAKRAQEVASAMLFDRPRQPER